MENDAFYGPFSNLTFFLVSWKWIKTVQLSNICFFHFLRKLKNWIGRTVHGPASPPNLHFCNLQFSSNLSTKTFCIGHRRGNIAYHSFDKCTLYCYSQKNSCVRLTEEAILGQATTSLQQEVLDHQWLSTANFSLTCQHLLHATALPVGRRTGCEIEQQLLLGADAVGEYETSCLYVFPK